MSTTTTIPAFAAITMTYWLNPEADGQLGDDGLSLYETALTAALQAEYPGAEVDVTVRLATVDASTFDAVCETTDGVDVRVYRGTVGPVRVAADPDELDFTAQAAIEEDFAFADRKAWQIACEGA
jgi:hypothetical protein